MGFAGGAEQRTEQRNVAQQWHLGDGLGDVVLNQPAKHNHLTVVGEDGALDRALVGHQIDRLGVEPGAGGDGGDFLLDLQAQGGAFVDAWRDLEGHADVLAFDGGEGVAGTRGVGGVGAGLEGHVLPDEDFRFLVVQGQQARRGQQVALAVGRECGDQCAEAVAADADDGAVGQGEVFRYFLTLQDLQHAAHRQAGTGEVDPAQATPAAAAAAGIHGPLHAEGVGDVAGHLDDGRFDHHLGARYVELTHDIFEGGDQIGLGQQHQGVETLVGADEDVRLSASGFAAFLILQAFGNLAEGFGQGLGVVVAQADHSRIGRAAGGAVQRAGKVGQFGAGVRRAEQNQAVGAGVGHHLGGTGALGLAAGDGGIEHFGGVHHPGVLQGHHAEVLRAAAVELPHQVFDAFDVGAAVADDQRVGRGDSSQMAVLRYQWTNQRDQLGHWRMLHLDQAGFQAIRRRTAGISFGLGLGVGHDARLIALGQHAETVGGHHREKQLIDLGQPQRRAGDHVDLALHTRVDDEGLPGDAGDLIDELADVGALEVDGPAFFLLIGAGRHLLYLREQGQGGSGQAGGEEGEGQSASENMHRFSRFP